MDFKKFKHDIKKEKLIIPELGSDLKNYSQQYDIKIDSKESINWFAIIKKFSLLMPIIAMLLIVSIVSISMSLETKSLSLHTIKDKNDLERVLSYDNSFDLDNWDDSWLEKGEGGFMTPGEDGSMGPQGPQGDTGYDENNSSDDYTSTNTQEQGVDEADAVKTDGKKIYYYKQKGNAIYVYDVDTLELKKIDLSCNGTRSCYSSSPLYITDKYLIFVGSFIEKTIDGYYYYGYYPYRNVLIEIYDKDTLQLVKSYSNLGNFIDSRVTNNTLYFIYNQRNVSELPYDYIDNEKNYYDYEDIKYSKETINQGYTFIISIKLDTLEVNSNLQLGVNQWTTVYATNESIYLVTSNRCSSLSLYTINGARYSASSYQTNIFRYKLVEGKALYQGIIITSGLIKNQFYLDEYEGYLRVVLQQQNNAVTGNNKLEIYDLSKNNSDGTIKLISIIDSGIGKEGEQIKSVRFSDDSCLVVTYLIIDPLYYIDLTDPKNPKILGQYEEPGYNTYLHYINDSLALGFGIDNGYKFGLYEIIDGTPNKLDQIDQYSSLSVVNNHKALFVDKDMYGFSSARFEGYIYEIYTINYDGEKPKLELVKKFTCEDDSQYVRMLRIGQRYYLLSFKHLEIYDINFELIEKLILD